MKGGGIMDLTHEQRLTSVEERAKSNSHRLDDVEKRQYKLDELVSAVNGLAIREKHVEDDVKEIKSDVKSLTNKPAQRWEGIVDKVIMTILGIVIGFIFTQIGM
jgi:uncharacterized protein YoxC